MIFDFLKKRNTDHKISKSSHNFDNNSDTKDISVIWAMKDKNDLIIALHEYLSDKCSYGDKLEKLTDQEKTTYLCQELEAAVNNGGFSQFFFNSSGNFAMDTLYSLKSIGAMKTYELLNRAISLFPDHIIPKDKAERENLLDEIDEEILNELDSAFYNYEDNLLELNYNFIMAQKDAFL